MKQMKMIIDNMMTKLLSDLLNNVNFLLDITDVDENSNKIESIYDFIFSRIKIIETENQNSRIFVITRDDIDNNFEIKNSKIISKMNDERDILSLLAYIKLNFL